MAVLIHCRETHHPQLGGFRQEEALTSVSVSEGQEFENCSGASSDLTSGGSGLCLLNVLTMLWAEVGHWAGGEVGFTCSQCPPAGTFWAPFSWPCSPLVCPESPPKTEAYSWGISGSALCAPSQKRSHGSGWLLLAQ